MSDFYSPRSFHSRRSTDPLAGRLSPFDYKHCSPHDDGACGLASCEKHTLVLVTAANSFLVEPIAKMLGFPNVICTQVEKRDGCLTGNISGVPAFQHGKVIRLTTWLLRERKLSLSGSWFYSDSHNDLPLLKLVDYPVMVEPDDVLRQYGSK